MIRDGPPLSAMDVVHRMLGEPPRWAQALLGLRHALVRPFGLKTQADAPADAINGFPILRADPSTAVLGFDDAHLDFRIVVTVTPQAPKTHEIRVTTLIRRHGLPGRAYLAAILPFHILIVRAALRRV